MDENGDQHVDKGGNFLKGGLVHQDLPKDNPRASSLILQNSTGHPTRTSNPGLIFMRLPIYMGYWPSLFSQDDWILTQKKEWGQYPAILTEKAWSIKNLLRKNNTLFLWEQRVLPSEQDRAILPAQVSQSQHRIPFTFPAQGASHIILYFISILHGWGILRSRNFVS